MIRVGSNNSVRLSAIAVVHTALLGVVCSTNAGDAVALPPTTLPSSKSRAVIDNRDYCTVILAPKLQERLKVDDAHLETLAGLKTKLYAYLDNAAGNIHSSQITPGLIAARSEVALGKIGVEVRQALTLAQQDALGQLFGDGTLKPIRVGAEVETGVGYRGFFTRSGIRINYSHYGDDSNQGISLSESPTTRSVAITSHPSPMSPGRRRRSEHFDVQAAIESLQSDSLPKQIFAATSLSRAVPVDDSRQAVLDALRPYVADTDDRHWPTFAEAFCVWAGPDDLKTVETVLDDSDQRTEKGQKESAAAAACTALLRLKPDEAVNAVNARIADSLFRATLISDVTRLQDAGGPSKPVADEMFDQLMHYHG